MRRHALFIVLLVLPATGACAQQDPAPGGLQRPLPPLELRETQEGAVGAIGQVLVIQPTGEWNASRVLNNDISDPYRSGFLTEDQLDQLAMMLDRYRFVELPEVAGEAAKINRHVFELTVGDRSILLALGAGDPLTVAGSEADVPPDAMPQYRFTRIIQGIRELVSQTDGSG
jgi:hypothetical protein